jgi:hypothetical protein
MPIIPAFERLRQEDFKFEVALGYILKKKKTEEKKERKENTILRHT